MPSHQFGTPLERFTSTNPWTVLLPRTPWTVLLPLFFVEVAVFRTSIIEKSPQVLADELHHLIGDTRTSGRANSVQIFAELLQSNDVPISFTVADPNVADWAYLNAIFSENTHFSNIIAFRGASAASDEKCEARAFEERAQRATRMRVRPCSVLVKFHLKMRFFVF